MTIPVQFDQLISGYSTWEKTKIIPSSLSEYDNKKITIKGFLYKNSNENWILASEPNLKSCCVGSHLKLNSQIIVYGDLPINPTSRAISIEGKLQITSKDSKYFYSLKEATIETNPLFYEHFWEVAILFALFYLAIHLIFRCLKR
jgi:hypothetical protein